MKKSILFVVCFLIIIPPAFCHPPQDIIITFDPATKMLEATIIHQVSNPNNHFIKKVDIAVNGKEVISHELTRQEDAREQKVAYRLTDLSSKDKVSVEAYCSISGKLEKEIEVK